MLFDFFMELDTHILSLSSARPAGIPRPCPMLLSQTKLFLQVADVGAAGLKGSVQQDLPV